MALISIPTSIGGVSIPGLAVNGPLGLLYKNPFGRNDLQYPRDLQSATRGHVVHFAINEINPLTYEEFEILFINKANEFGQALSEGIVNAKQKITSRDAEAQEGGFYGEPVKSFMDKALDGTYTKEANLLFKNRTKKSNKSISLYMPDTLNFTYSASYGQTDLLAAAGSVPIIVDGVNLNPVSAVTQALKNPLSKLIMKGMGYALNPNQQVLFDGIDFRNYQLEFMFTPYSKQEAETVAAIIKMFKIHSAPRLVEGAGGGMFFVPPSTFTPTFKFNGQKNKNISQVTESVITNINVDYAPQGFSAHTDGAPVQTRLTIEFKELELITSQKVEQGY